MPGTATTLLAPLSVMLQWQWPSSAQLAQVRRRVRKQETGLPTGSQNFLEERKGLEAKVVWSRGLGTRGKHQGVPLSLTFSPRGLRSLLELPAS